MNNQRPFCFKAVIERLKKHGIEGDEETAHARLLYELLDVADAINDDLKASKRTERLLTQDLERAKQNFWIMQSRRDKAQGTAEKLEITTVQLSQENDKLEQDLCREGKRRVMYQDMIYRAMNKVDSALGRFGTQGSTLDTFAEDLDTALDPERYDDE